METTMKNRDMFPPPFPRTATMAYAPLAMPMRPIDRAELELTPEQSVMLEGDMRRMSAANLESATLDELGLTLIRVTDATLVDGGESTFEVSFGVSAFQCLGLRSFAEPGDHEITSFHCGFDGSNKSPALDANFWNYKPYAIFGAGVFSSFAPIVISARKLRADARPFEMFIVCRSVDRLSTDAVSAEDAAMRGSISVRSYTGEVPTAPQTPTDDFVLVPIVSRPNTNGTFAIEVVAGGEDVYEAVGLQAFNAADQVALVGVWNGLEKRKVFEDQQGVDLSTWPSDRQARHFNMGKFSRARPLLLAFRTLGKGIYEGPVAPANLVVICRRVSG